MAITKIPSGDNYTNATANAAANTKGNWVEMVASTLEAVKGFWFTSVNGSSAGTRISLDIGTGAAASEVVLVSDIHWSMGDEVRGNAPCFYLPVSIPASTRVALRGASSTGGATNLAAALHLVGGSGGGTCVTYGVSSNQAVQIDPGGTINTKSGYTEITPATSADIAYLAVLIHMNANTAPTGALYNVWVAIGGAGSETDVISNIAWSANAGGDHWTPSVHTFPIVIPSGTRISVAAASTTNDATDRLFRVSLIGFSAVPS